MPATESGVPRMRRIDELCDQFEQDWLEGRRPSMETTLRQAVEEEHAELFRALLDVELELRRGEQPVPRQAEYLRRFPAFHQEILDAFAREEPRKIDNSHAPDAAGATSLPANQVIMQVVSGPQAGKQFSFTVHDTFLVGRSPRAHLQLQKDPHFSRFHFRLEVNPPACYLIDLGSRNGTFVNGKQVQECHLQDGDIISGGMTELKILAESADKTLILSPKPAQGPLAERTPILAGVAPQPEGTARKPAASAGLAIPGYSLQEEIGRGDLGIVYRAVQLTTGKVVALKVMTPARAMADKALQLFLRECTVLNQLQHPHTIQLLDHGNGPGYLYLATEYVPTIDFPDLLSRRSLTDRLKLCGGLMSQILSTLQFAHRQSLVHRDIKPGNILVAKEGSRLTAKLADFGVAKHYANAGFSQITRAGDVIGSLPFMPPEQFLNSREARPACDLYAAGATLYSWLTNHTPHDFPPGRNQFLVVLEDAPVPIVQRQPEIPPAIAAFLDRALARQPEHRFSSAEEMRHSLKSALR